MQTVELPIASSLAQVVSVLFSGVTFLTVLAAAWKLSSILTTFNMQLKTLSTLPTRISAVEDQLMTLEADINNLWAAQRGGEPDQTRKALWKPNRLD